MSYIMVDNAPLRKAFLHSDINASQLARKLNWYRFSSKCVWLRPDTTRIRRVLGIAKSHSHGYTYYQKAIRIDTALRIAEILDLDPIDIGA